jgi:hypothetical protein
VRGFCDLLARFGVTPIPLATLRTAVATEAERALRDVGILRAGPLSRHLPCGADEAGCSRAVRGFDDDDDLGLGEAPPASAPTYVAVCSRSPHACDAIDVTADELARVVVVPDALVRTLVQLFALTPARRAAKGDTEPRLLGESNVDGAPRDALLLLHPRADLELRLAARERDARPATFYVPSSLGIDDALFARFGAGSHVELARLADRLALRGGAIVAAPRLHVVAAPRDARPANASADPRALPRVESWLDLRVCGVDGEAILLTAYGKSSRRTYVDMGLASKSNRKPLKAWRVLLAMLEGGGQFTWSQFGNYEAAAKAVSDLRKALQRGLGCDDDPFVTLSGGEGWRPRFEAKPEPPRDRLRGGI